MTIKRSSICLLAPVLSLLLVLGCTPSSESLRRSLMGAVEEDDAKEVRRLINKGADANSRESPGGWSALHYAAQHGNVEIVELLLSAGADPNYVGTSPGQTGTVISVRPLALAQSISMMIQQMHGTNLVFTPNNPKGPGVPALLKSMSDPNATDRYQKVIDILTKVTSAKPPWEERGRK